MLVQGEEKMFQISLTEYESDEAEKGIGVENSKRNSKVNVLGSEDVTLNGQFEPLISKPRKRKLGMGDLFQGIHPRPAIRERFNRKSRVVQVYETEPEVTKVVTKSRRNGMWNIFLGMDVVFLGLLGIKRENCLELVQRKEDSLCDVTENTDIVMSYADIMCDKVNV